jgi:sirohydrochlorin cobaltochelatase
LKGLILFAHGSRDREWARPFEQLAATLSRRTDATVRLAYLELMEPTLGDAIATLVRDGAKSIRIVPVFLGQGGHTKRDLPKLAAAARERHPGVDISLEPPVGEQPSVIDAIAEALTRPAGRSSP